MMKAKDAKIRLYVDTDLGADTKLVLDKPTSHYLISVMRRKAGDKVLAFNGRDGEWETHLTKADRKAAVLNVEAQFRPQSQLAPLALAFAPVKRAKTDLIIEKATELGVTRLIPVMTERTITERIKHERLCAIAKEAAEQCGRLNVPEIAHPVPLFTFLAEWKRNLPLYFCDESAPEKTAHLIDAAYERKSDTAEECGILIGPEGGFSPADGRIIGACEATVPVHLGTLILRAETAAIAAITIVQSIRESEPSGLQ